MSEPTTIEDLFHWPQFVIDQMKDRPDIWENFKTNVKNGIAVRTHYSGYDTPLIAAHWVQQAMREEGVDVGSGFVSVHACDKAEECLTTLNYMSQNTAGGPAHCFADMADRLSDHHRSTIFSMMPDLAAVRSCKDHDAKVWRLVSHAREPSQRSNQLAGFLGVFWQVS